MLDRLKRHEGLLVGVGSLLWFLVQTPWGRFPDPDAFYHAHLANLMLDRGALHAFPWLDMTSLGSNFADHHYLYHLILGPAIAAFDLARVPFAEMWATELMAPLLATVTAVALWTVLRAMHVKSAWVWVLLALLIPGFSFRLLLAKASPLAIGAFVAVMGAVALRRPMTAFFAGAIFALAHGGWIIALAVALAMVLGDMLARRLIEDDAWETAIRDAPWQAFRALLAGVALGLVIHPNRLELVQFLWVQTFKAGLVPSSAVIQGNEWLPAVPGVLVGELAPLMIAFLLGILGMLVARKGTGSRELGTVSETGSPSPAPGSRFPVPGSLLDRMRLSIMLALPVAMTVVLTLKSRRFVEYLVPALTLWIASLWQFVDVERLKTELTVMRRDLAPLARRIIVPFLVVLALALAAHHALLTWTQLHRPASNTFDAYRATFDAIRVRATAGDRVFHSDWDEFPILFAADDRLRYVSGLDPTFLHEASSTLSDQVRDLTIGRTTSTAWDVIVGRTRSRFIFVTTKRHPNFDATVRSDGRFKELARDETTAAYEVVP